MSSPRRIRSGNAADLDAVAPLWTAVHHQHVQAMPELAPYVSDEETCRVRRALYDELLAKPDTLLLLAFLDDRVVGYGLAHYPNYVAPASVRSCPTGSRYTCASTASTT